MKCQILFSGKDKKKIINLSFDDFAYRMIRNTDAIMTYLLTRLCKLPQNELEKIARLANMSHLRGTDNFPGMQLARS